MNKIVIVADSTCDLGKDLREKYNIEYVPMNYVLDNNEYVASLDWQVHSSKEFYDFMRDGMRIKTTQVPRERYVEKFTALLDGGNDVIYISCSSALSGSVNLARLVSNELNEKYSDNKVYCVDSLISSLGQSLLAIKAAELVNEGKSAEEIVSWLEENRLKVNQFGAVDSLEYLRRAGRVKASKAFFGNLFGIKPILISDKIGQNFAVKKVKGMVNALKEVAANIAECVESPEEQILYISHTDANESANLLKDEILSAVPFKSAYVSCIGPIVGASVGPGTVIAFCFGKEVTTEGKE